MAKNPRPATNIRRIDEDTLLATLLEDGALLASLLDEPVPATDRIARPVSLRSTAEQRTLALRPFLLKTWVDRALHITERLLLVGVVVTFAYWIVDGPVRDWFYQQRRGGLALAEAHATPTPPLRVRGAAGSDQVAGASPTDTAELPTLPFTTPNMERSTPDFLAPQSGRSAPAVADPRPRRLLIPSLELDTPVVEVFVVDGAWQVADYAAGYHNGTGLPGMAGNLVMAGHAGLRGAVFRDIGLLNPGDEVVVETSGWRYRYRVRESKAVWPTQTEVMSPTATAVLTLITCTNWDTQRLVVSADLIDSRPLT